MVSLNLFRSSLFAKCIMEPKNYQSIIISLSRLFLRPLTTSPVLSKLPGILFPHHVSKMWAVNKRINPLEYTVDPLPFVRTGGRGPDGRIQLKHVTTGLNRPYFLVDYVRSRQVPSASVHEEVVLKITKNWWRHPFLALVASGETKRWIIATTKMKPSDIIRSHSEIPLIPVSPAEGDAYPVGALPIGTQICLIEVIPGEGALYCRTAGASATVVRRGTGCHLPGVSGLRNSNLLTSEALDDSYTCTVRLAGTRREVRLLPECVVVVGQVSNEEHDKHKFPTFGAKKQCGIKQRSGLFQKKTGRFGRKIYPVDSLEDRTKIAPSMPEFKAKFTLPGVPEFTREKERVLYDQLLQILRPRIKPVPREYNGLPDTLPRFTWRHY